MDNHFIIVKDNNYNIVFHSDTGSIMIVDSNKSISFEQLNEQLSERKRISQNRLMNEEEALRHLIFNVSELCNLKCRYCYADEGKYGTNGLLMSESVANEAINSIFEHYKKGVKRVSFFGGEPLASFALIVFIVNKIREKCIEFNVKIPKYGTITNGTLIDDKKADFIAENFDSVTISIDGPKCVHDKVRIMKDGSGSYDKAINGLKLLKKRNVTVCASMVVNKNHINYCLENNSNLTEMKNALYDLGFDYVSYGPVITEDNTLKLEDEEKYVAIVRKDVAKEYEMLLNGSKRFSKQYYTILKALVSKQYVDECNCGLCQVFVSAEGDYYPCHFFYNKHLEKIGGHGDLDIEQRVNVQKKYVRNSVDKCKECYLKNYCSVWCPGSSESFGDKVGCVQEIACKMLKVVFEETLKALVAAQRDPQKLSILVKSLKEYSQVTNNDFGVDVHD